MELSNRNNQTNPDGNSVCKNNNTSMENDDTSDSDSETRDKSGLNIRESRSIEELNIDQHVSLTYYLFKQLNRYLFFFLVQPTFYSQMPPNA